MDEDEALEAHRALSVDGERPNSHIYYCSCLDGYQYHRVAAPLADGRWSYTCRNRPQCPGRAQSAADGRGMVVTTNHSCAPDPDALAVRREREAIIQAAMECPRRLVAETIAGRIQQ